jgi:hypothetical protein
MFPINLVLFQWCLKLFDKKLKTSLPEFLDFENWHKKIRVGPYATNDELILVDPVEDEEVEEIRPRTDPPNFWQFDLKK